ncbi:putative ribonuclease H-like domain-containing protein [Tanacetum coccineum]
MEDRALFDSGCSGHMTGNKDHLDDFEEYKGGSVTFGGSKGYITSKGRIKVGNLDFDSMPDENQILLKVPRQHNMYNFDMKTPSLTKDYACLITKATSIESKLWHRRNKGIKQEYSNAQTPQQNGVAKRINRTLIEAARTMLADSLLPTTFWAESSTSEVTNNAGTLQSPNANASEEADASAVKVGPRKSFTNSKEDKDLDQLAQKHLREVTTDKATKLTIFNKPQKGIFNEASYDEEGMVHDFNNLPTEVAVSPIPTLRIYNIHPQSQILGDPKSYVQTRSRVKQTSGAHALEPKKISEALKDDSWVDAMQEELLQFRLQQVWILVDLPHRANMIGTKWVYRNKRDERGVVVRNKERLVAQGHRQEEGIDYDEVFAPMARIKSIRTSSSPKSLKDIMLVQVYVDDIIFGSTRKSWCDEFEALMKGRFQMSSMGELIFFLGLQVKQKIDGIFISQDKYVADMLKKFDLASVKTAITPMETKMALTKDEEADDVDVTPKTSHLNAVKRIFKYLKGKPNLGLWYPRESSFDLEAFSDSDYAGANLDRKSTTGGCQFLGSRLISWQCKKQTIVATSTTEAEYVAAASCCGQVLWIQNQMLDYGFNFMNTKIHIDNESTICIVKNPVYHSKTKHIEIRHHFIRDSYEKKLIRVEKIHTDFNVADLLTKAFDGPRFKSGRPILILVGFLKKPEGSAGFEQIVDFLKGIHIMYALEHNPTIYVSVIKQFWQTITVITLDNGEQELKARIDTHEY